MVKATKLPSGKWRAVAFLGTDKDGKRIRKSFTASTKKEAEVLANCCMHENKSGPDDKRTVKDVVNAYIDSRSSILSPSTIRSYRTIAEKRLGNISEVLAAELTTEQLQNHINSINLNSSAKTVKNISSLINSALEMALPEKRFKIALPTRIPVKYSIPTDKQIQELIQNADDELKLAIVLSAFGTLRRGEVCALKYEDVLYDMDSVYVHSDIVMNSDREWVYKPIPKNSSSVRRVRLPKEVIEMIGEGTGYIFNSNPDAITARFCRLRDKLHLECRFHDLRHYSASIMHAIGIPDQYIQSRGGWGTDGTLKSVYRNVLDDKEDMFTKKVNSYLSQNISIKNA